MKKVIIVSSAAIIFLILAIVTSTYSLNIAKSAIDDIGTISLSDDSLEKIDFATEKYANLASGYGASIYLIDYINDYVDYEKLLKAQSEYTYLAIGEVITNYETSPEEYVDEYIEDDLQEVRNIIDAYYPDKNYSNIDNYEDFVKLEKLYGISNDS